jgi:acetylornithine deacetylase
MTAVLFVPAAAHPEEAKYAFATPSTMKPTQVTCSQGAINQLPAWATMSGDIRLTPFYEVPDVMKKVEEYVAQINKDLKYLPTRGPCSKYEIPDQTGKVELTWGEHYMEGIACSLESEGYTALCDATKEVVGKCTPYSICGSLPLVRDLQRGGFDVQLTGYGLSSTYHADNEYCEIPMMANGFKILLRVLANLEGK